MPGAMVLVNSIDSMLDFKLLHAPPAMIEEFVTVASIIGVGYVFARFDSIVATLIILPTFPFLLILLNGLLLRGIWLFPGGVWLDFSVPLLGIFAHREIAGAKEYIAQWRAGKLAQRDTHDRRTEEN
jgi:hypothetical protein